MRQILQNLANGDTTLTDVPSPKSKPGYLLISSQQTLVSAGTERMLVDFGKANWINKARQQPDKVRMVLDKVRTDGLATTLDAVQSKLDQPLALGYCNVGRVAEVGAGVDGFAVGDRVVSNGNHAQVVNVPKNLCARIPDSVSDEHASFTVLGAIGLQGIRLVNPTLGECVVVTGLGLIGLLTVQMLRAQGCRVLGIDFDPARLEMAKRFGAEVVNPGAGEDVLSAATAFSRGRGVDAVIITASTKSNEPVSQAANMCRQRGRIVLVGVTGLELSRADFYEKELSFQVSCSYGPGRYDPAYEEGGQDYPVGFVRWTEQRNFEAVLDLMASGQLDLEPLISHRFDLVDAVSAYDLLSSGESSLGILLKYPEAEGVGPRVVELAPARETPVVASGAAGVGFLGAGNYAGRVLIPAFKAAGADLQTVVSGGGVSSVHYGKKHGFRNASTDGAAMLADEAVNTVVIATRHNAHARQVIDALQAGKHVFCEKPLCLTQDELKAIKAEADQRPDQLLMIGFNRRFAPQVITMKSLLDTVAEPKNLVMTVNAGDIPTDHWTQDPEVGGGRIVGEGCHFIDLLRHLVGAPIVSHHSVALGRHPTLEVRDDKATITLSFADGSIGTVHYLANGDKGFPKERLEVFCAGRVLQLDNFRKLKAFGWPGAKDSRLWRQDKGQNACASAFISAIKQGGAAPISRDEIFEVSRVTLEVAEQLRN
ncbi:bi-domain-containing oxidoreductase [Marinobacter sediminum]|uniref:bi-domain-containing oxidoreductase n=1 Tax=Marinobacter sediminum TaxID=256323 RepID=UPI00202F8FC3|nr:bi-domain-containing oxidoreductase [Marinobacter sediminum]MCM0612641.1 bi-domain-containing oxidoreductase [Marinobacter sediminum]